MTDTTDPPPAAAPWYTSKILQGLITIVVTQVIGKLQTLYHFDTTLLGFGVNDIVAWLMDVISAGAALYATHARVTQKAVPVMTGTQATADQINIDNPSGAPTNATSPPSTSTTPARPV